MRIKILFWYYYTYKISLRVKKSLLRVAVSYM